MKILDTNFFDKTLTGLLFKIFFEEKIEDAFLKDPFVKNLYKRVELL